MDSIILFWFVIAFFFLILEMGSPGLFYFLSFCIGALAAALAGLLELSSIGQGVIFLGVSASALFILKYVLDLSHNAGTHHKTNVYALQGKRGIVTQEITRDQPGRVKVGGEVWAARSIQGTTISQGTAVEIVNIQGASVIVKEIIQ